MQAEITFQKLCISKMHLLQYLGKEVSGTNSEFQFFPYIQEW